MNSDQIMFLLVGLVGIVHIVISANAVRGGRVRATKSSWYTRTEQPQLFWLTVVAFTGFGVFAIGYCVRHLIQ